MNGLEISLAKQCFYDWLVKQHIADIPEEKKISNRKQQAHERIFNY